MLDTLTSRLARIVKTIRGEARLTEANIQEALREVRVALLEADVAQRLLDVLLGETRFAANRLDDAREAGSQGIEHGVIN